VARRRLNARWFQIPDAMWIDPKVDAEEILARFNRNY